MRLWGCGHETRDLGFVERNRCETCGKERPFKLFVRCRYTHIAHLFRWGRQKKYYLVCHRCRRGRRVDPAQVKPKLAATAEHATRSAGRRRA